MSEHVILYADERTSIGTKAISYLQEKHIPFVLIPTTGIIPRANYGVANYEYFEHREEEFASLAAKFHER